LVSQPVLGRKIPRRRGEGHEHCKD
jgi:hypothetical protein